MSHFYSNKPRYLSKASSKNKKSKKVKKDGELGDRQHGYPYTLLYPHSIPLNQRKWDQDYQQIISIDPGIINLAFRVERRYEDDTVETLDFERVKVKERSLVESKLLITGTMSSIVQENTYLNIIKFLDSKEHFFEDTHIVIIERQVNDNRIAVRVDQTICTYFMLKLRNTLLLPSIILIDPNWKYTSLKAPKDVDKGLWAVEKSLELSKERDDIGALNKFKEVAKGRLKADRKSDDIADALIQVEGYFLYKTDHGY